MYVVSLEGLARVRVGLRAGDASESTFLGSVS